MRSWGLPFLVLCALAMSLRAERPTIHTLTTEQGLMSDGGIFSIQQDAQGFLWFATHEGVSRYDGSTFRNYGVGQGFSSPAQASKILITSTGDLWVTFNAARYRPDAPEQLLFRPIAVGHQGARPAALIEDHAHALWAIAEGLYRNRDPVHTDAFERVCLNGKEVCAAPEALGYALLEGGDHSIWAAEEAGGVVRLRPDGRVEHYGAAEHLPYKVLTFLRDNEDRIWAGTTHGLVRFADTPAPGRNLIAEDLTQRSHFSACAVNALLQSRDGHLWAGTRCGLTEINGRSLHTYTIADGLTQDVIGAIYEDRNGELWIGTESAGVMRMERKHISAFGAEAGLEQEVIDGTLLMRDGRVAVLAARAGHLIMKVGDRSGFQSLFPPLPLQPTDLGFQHWQTALEDHEGKWWIPGTNTLGVFAAPGARAKASARPERTYTVRSGLPPGRIDCMLEDRQGDVWFGIWNPPHSTLMQWVRATGRFQSWEGTPGVSADRVPVALMQTRSGSIWISYAQGDLGRYRNGQHILIPSSPGRGTTIQSVYEDDFGRLWTGRRNSTFYEILQPDGEHPLLKEIPEVRAPFLRTILGDSRGRLYLASEAGLIEYDPRTKSVKHFNESDGLPSDVVQNGVRDRSGAFWFGTGRGLMRFEPQEASSEPAARVWLDRVTVDGVVLGGLSDRGESNVDHLRFRESAGALKLDFNSIHFTSDVQFQYRLTPGDRDWSPPTVDRSVTYAGLRGGSYQFAVRAVDAEVSVSQPATVSFRVVPPLWRRSWFLLAVAVLLCAALFLAYRTRVEHLLQMERLRMRIASDLHDDIGATLTHITVLSEQLRSTRLVKEADDQLQQIVNAAREMTSSVADVVWSISPQRDHLSDLLSRMRRLGNDLCDAHDITFSLHSQDDSALSRVNGHVRHQFLLIFKEALRNAVRHSRCRHFAVECRTGNPGIQLVFQDDGIGFDSQRQRRGLGLVSMQRRAVLAGGALVVQSSPGQGTTITVSTEKL